MAILLTGGLGYIGSHIAHMLGSDAVIIDNLTNSNIKTKSLLPKAHFYRASISSKTLKKIFLKYDIKGVIHLAGLKSVDESTKSSLHYYKNNINSTLELLENMEKFKINKIIFSSSATVYGDIHQSPLKEEFSLSSTNPYGSTKIIIEQMIKDYCISNKRFSAISLRYFNPIGANYQAGLSDQPIGKPQNIMPVLIESVQKKKNFKIFGNDYPTFDGSCIRDYIHILDLADAHIKAFKYLKKFKGHLPLNVGLGKGLSVFEFIKHFEKSNKIMVKYKIIPRRNGDVPISFADNKKIKKLLKWKPKYNYDKMMSDSWLARIQDS